MCYSFISTKLAQNYNVLRTTRYTLICTLPLYPFPDTYLWSLSKLSGLREGPSFKIRRFLTLVLKDIRWWPPKHSNFRPTPERCYLYEQTVNSWGLKVCHRGPQVPYLKTQKYDFLAIICQNLVSNLGCFWGYRGVSLTRAGTALK